MHQPCMCPVQWVKMLATQIKQKPEFNMWLFELCLNLTHPHIFQQMWIYVSYIRMPVWCASEGNEWCARGVPPALVNWARTTSLLSAKWPWLELPRTYPRLYSLLVYMCDCDDDRWTVGSPPFNYVLGEQCPALLCFGYRMLKPSLILQMWPRRQLIPLPRWQASAGSGHCARCTLALVAHTARKDCASEQAQGRAPPTVTHAARVAWGAFVLADQRRSRSA